MKTMIEVVYALCALTSLACAVLLLRGFYRTRSRLLLWSGLCFIGLMLNNVLLFLDLVIFPEYDLALVRNLTALIGLLLLVYGLVTDAT
jgi:hypothetical protein